MKEITKKIRLFTIPFLIASLISCSPQITVPKAVSLPAATGISATPIRPDFKNDFSNFGIQLTQQCNAEQPAQNILVSPLSVIYALGMTANGAAGSTLDQIRQTIAPNLTLDQLNQALYSYLTNLSSTDSAKLTLANSIWFDTANQKATLKDAFLQKNADHYQTELFQTPFSDTTKQAINQWVSQKTDQMILSIIDQIPENVFMYLINGLVFDGEWEEPFESNQVNSGQFHNLDGSNSSVDMLSGFEAQYFENDTSIGFCKPYAGRKYAFVGILPKDPSQNINNWFHALSSQSLADFLHPLENTMAQIQMPVFRYDYSYDLKMPLQAIGMPLAFTKQADFSNLADSDLPIYINRVLHKTAIENTAYGTKAAAVTAVELKCGSANIEPTVKPVLLNRPFVYLIIDTEQQLPLFIGLVKSLD